jgi:rubrerythrin
MRPLHELILQAAAHQRPGLASRRGVLALVAAAAPAAIGLDAALAEERNEPNRNRNRNKNRGKNRNNKNKNRNKNRGRKNTGGNGGDIDVLNYALTLEHLEYAFYRDGLAMFGAGDFPPGVFALLQDIRDHEDAHVDTLSSVIASLGGTPVQEACYDFGYDNAAEFLDVAQLLENTGVMAYAGALAEIESGELQTAGATIATVEARHASYLNLQNGDNPFPDAFDMAKSMDEILAAAGGFIVPCR